MLESLLDKLPEFLSDAFIDSVKLLPSLFLIFVLIEVFENFFAHKIPAIVAFSKKLGPILGAGLAIIPQCGFSVIMTTLFLKKYITLGTLLAVYIATSDEAIPILLANPSEFVTVAKIVLIKLLLGIFVGYLTDLIVKPHLHECEEKPCTHIESFEPEKGCCAHDLKSNKLKSIIIHPLKHTFIIFGFILLVCICLNYIFETLGEDVFINFANHNVILQTGFFAIFGLIPNCAVSVLITMMYLKSTITFGSVIAGLTSNAGLGILVLFTKKESWKSFLQIVSILVLVGFFAGFIFS